jgi:hypothetical protein
MENTMAGEQILEKIAELLEAGTLTRELAEAVLAVTLFVQPQSNDYFTYYESTPNPDDLAYGTAITAVDFRTPTAEAQAQGPLLNVTIAPNQELPADRVLDFFGGEPRLVVPSPPLAGGPPDATTVVNVYEYAYANGVLRLGIGPGPEEYLLQFVIDQTGD